MSSIVLMSAPGHGKTTMACTMTKLGYKVHVIDLDRKIHKMINIKSLIDSGQVTYWQPKSNLSSDDLGTALALKGKIAAAPQGYTEIITYLNGIIQKPPEDAPGTVLVMDSVTQMSRHMRRHLQMIAKKDSITFDEWAFLRANYEELFDYFFNLNPPFAHCIANCHVMGEENPTTRTMEFKPMIEGSFRDAIGQGVEEMYFLRVRQVGVKVVYEAINKPIERVAQARTSRLIDQPVTTADFSEIFKGEKV